MHLMLEKQHDSSFPRHVICFGKPRGAVVYVVFERPENGGALALIDM